jgi:hypothetical protein
MKRQQEYADQSHSLLKRFTQQELNDEACPTYKNLLVGRSRRMPDRQTIIHIAEYLECTSDERNDLLLAAGYLPIHHELEGRSLELELEQAQQIMSNLPFPAMIVTHTLDIKGFNEPFRNTTISISIGISSQRTRQTKLSNRESFWPEWKPRAS